MKRKTWVVASLLAATVGLSSCATVEGWLYGDSKNSRQDMVRYDKSSRDRDSRNRTTSDDNDRGGLFSSRDRRNDADREEGGLLNRRNRDDERMSRNDRSRSGSGNYNSLRDRDSYNGSSDSYDGRNDRP